MKEVDTTPATKTGVSIFGGDAIAKLHDGDTIRTYAGEYVNVFETDPATILVVDIAHGLSNVCRFAGHTYVHYSVAQHCIECVKALQSRGTTDKKILRTLLMHDATEAYLGDMARPIKRRMPEYKKIEMALEAVIAAKFDLHFPFPPIIKEVDRYQLEVEHLALMRRTEYMHVLSPYQAREMFLKLFAELS
jgi:5'-deoxynucleotidase YfbR-like HD superfamily hydrolase